MTALRAGGPSGRTPQQSQRDISNPCPPVTQPASPPSAPLPSSPSPPQPSKHHTLLATPTTVAWGYYSARQTRPHRPLRRHRHHPDPLHLRPPRAPQIPRHRRRRHSPLRRRHLHKVSRHEKGPGGHILTGPVAIAEAEPGDVLEVRIQKINIDVPWACNGFGCRPRLPAQRLPLQPHPHHPPRPRKDDRPLRPRHRHPAPPLLRLHGHRPTRIRRQVQLRSTLDARRQHGQQGDWSPAPPSIYPRQRQRRPLRSRRRPRRSGQRRSRHHRPRNPTHRHLPVHRPQSEATPSPLAPRRNPHRSTSPWASTKTSKPPPRWPSAT